MLMSLEALSNLAKIGKIKAEPMNRAEIDRLLAMARKRLRMQVFCRFLKKAASQVPTTQSMQRRWRHFAGTVIEVKTGTSFFNPWDTHFNGRQASGACWMQPIKNVTWQSMKASLKLRSQQSRNYSTSLTN